jgi:hypothetical protein
MNLATTSLPVPDSPTSRTVVSVDATCVAALSTACHASEGPTMRPASPRAPRQRADTRFEPVVAIWLRPPHGQVGGLFVETARATIRAAGDAQLPLIDA